jgi:flagellar protein FlgJ
MRKVAPVQAPKATFPTREVAAQRTPVDPARLRAALATAYKHQTGAEASTRMLDVLTAQVSLETGRGERMYNFNFGGIKGQGPSGATAHYRTTEIAKDGSELSITDGFRAYRSLQEGASDYLATLKSRYPEALAAASRGDVDRFAQALKQRGYFTAHLEDYSAALRGLVKTAPAAAQGTSRALAVAEVAPPSFTLPSTPTEGVVFATTDIVSRVMDVVAAMSATVGAPIEDPKRRG